jgi:hypothetical protein
MHLAVRQHRRLEPVRAREPPTTGSTGGRGQRQQSQRAHQQDAEPSRGAPHHRLQKCWETLNVSFDGGGTGQKFSASHP